MKGSLYGFMFVYEGKYVDCPQLDKLIKASGANAHDVQTPAVKVEVNRDIQDLKLVFPFPHCAKAAQN